MSETRKTPEAPPLTETFGWLSRLREDLYLNARIGVPDGGEEWISAGESLANGDLLRDQLRRTREKWDLNNRDTAIGVVGGLAWQVGGAAVFCYATARRVPDLAPESLALRYADGDLEEVAFSEGFAALAGDPAAEKALAVFNHEDALLGWLRRGLEQLLEPTVSEVRKATRVSARTLWGRATDLLAQTFLELGPYSGDQDWCGAQAEKLVKAPESPFNGNTEFFTVEHAGTREVFMTRAICCHGYKDPEHGYCDSCPVLTQEDRERLALEELVAR